MHDLARLHEEQVSLEMGGNLAFEPGRLAALYLVASSSLISSAFLTSAAVSAHGQGIPTRLRP